MNERQAGGGIGFAGALAILFIGLKLTGFITWPWLWVLCPLWLPVAIALTLVLMALAIGVYESIRNAARRRRRTRHGLPQENQHGPAHRWGRRGRG